MLYLLLVSFFLCRHCSCQQNNTTTDEVTTTTDNGLIRNDLPVIILSPSNLTVLEGNNISIMTSLINVPLDMQQVTLTFTVKFLTADMNDLTPNQLPKRLTLTNTTLFQNITIETAKNNDNANETLVVMVSSDRLAQVNIDEIFVTIWEPLDDGDSIQLPLLVNASEGGNAVICIDSPLILEEDSVVVGLRIQDITTSADKYNDTSLPNFVVLTSRDPGYCLQIPISINDDDGVNSTESFQVMVSLCGNREMEQHVVLVNVFDECVDGEVRLVNRGSQKPSEGRVEICTNGVFGIVCDAQWTVQDANVICRQLGYSISQENSTAVEGSAEFGEGSGPIFLSDVDCRGDEVTVSSCPARTGNGASVCTDNVGVRCPQQSSHTACESHQVYCCSEGHCLNQSNICDGIPDCLVSSGPPEDEVQCPFPKCNEGDIMAPLVGGANRQQGLVEVCTGGWYVPIEGKFFTISEASVICRQLGLGSAGYPLSITDDFRGLNTESLFDLPHIAMVICNGYEKQLSECTITRTLSTDFAAVQCIGRTECPDGAVRLKPSTTNPVGNEGEVREGRLEICYQGVWGAVFDMDWSSLDAAVACRQLGMDTRGALPLVPALYPTDPPTLPIVYDSPSCDSTSYISVLDCPRETHQCREMGGGSTPGMSGSGSGMDELVIVGELGTLTCRKCVGINALNGVVGVKCEVYEDSNCVDGDVRLTYRERNTASGNLEICFANEWMIVCSQDSGDPLFHQNDLNVACTSLGFNGFQGSDMNHRFVSPSVLGAGPKLNQSFQCNGSEMHLRDCNQEYVELSPLCSDIRIECLAPPRIFFNPHLRFGTSISVEENRRKKLSCFVDEPSYPPVDDITVSFQSDTLLSLLMNTSNTNFLYCNSATVYETNNATSSDSGIYNCSTFSGNMLSSKSVTLVIQNDVSDDDAIEDKQYLRFSSVSDQRLFFLSLTSMDDTFFENLVYQSINPNIPGHQRVECILASRRTIDIERDLSRWECAIVNLGPPSVVEARLYSTLFTAAEGAASVLERLHPNIVFTNISDTGFCDFNQTMYKGVTYTWPESVGGELLAMSCPNSTGHIMRLCSHGGHWMEHDTVECQIALDVINRILNETISEENIVMQITALADVLEKTEEDILQQTEAVLNGVSRIFDSVENIVSIIPQQVVSGLVRSLGSLQQWPADGNISENNISSRIIQSFEMVVTLFAESLETGTTINQIVPRQIIFTAENTGLDSLQTTGRSFSAGNDTFTIEGASLSLRPDQQAFISLPPNLFLQVPNIPSIGVFFLFYSMPSLFPLRATPSSVLMTDKRGEVGRRGVIRSPVISTTVGSGIKFNRIDPPIMIHLRLTRDEETYIANGSERCVFWDFDGAEGQGNWSSNGCTLVTSDGDVVTCNCTHLTNFAILVDICLREEDCQSNHVVVDTVLSYITYIGISLSLFGLTFTIVTMLAFKKIRSHDSSKYHVQLSIALFCMILIFVAGIEQTEPYAGCVIVSGLIHYFTLASILWMSAEALLMVQKLVFVFRKITTRFIITVSLLCWLLPLISVLLPLIIDLATGNDPSMDYILRRDAFCFLSDRRVFWGAFLAPIFCILILNIILYVVVIIIVIKHMRSSTARRKETISIKTIIRLLISIMGIMSLFGLSWVFAVLTFTSQPAVQLPAQILFAISCSFQGFFIFLFLCVLSKEVRESWKELLSCGRYMSTFLHPSIIGKKQAIHSAASSTLQSTRINQSIGKNLSDYKSNKILPKKKSVVQQHKLESKLESPLPPPPPPPPDGTATTASSEITHCIEEKPMNIHIKRYSTKVYRKHHVEEFQVDFKDSASSSSDGEDNEVVEDMI